jgi:hypothetical protein
LILGDNVAVPGNPSMHTGSFGIDVETFIDKYNGLVDTHADKKRWTIFGGKCLHSLGSTQETILRD